MNWKKLFSTAYWARGKDIKYYFITFSYSKFNPRSYYNTEGTSSRCIDCSPMAFIEGDHGFGT